ncbi:MAG TPA: histidine kinase [Bacteroidales bacterium]|nr:MAG: Oxygen sensor histidine kinase NreB [Bacteroidetes bacterium ADurb.Bin217]HPM12966.1 histidine kinase [Bacteroidales bacterium]
MKLDLTIREKLVIFYIALGFVAVSSLGIYSFMSVRDAIINRSFEQLTSVREVKKARLQQFFHDRKKETELLAGTPNVFILSDTNSHIINTTQVDSFLLKGNYISSIHVVSGKNSQIFSKKISQDNTSMSKLSESEDSCIISIAQQTIRNQTCHIFDYTLIYGEYAICIASPILSNSNKDVLILAISPRAINEIMLEKNSFGGLGESGESYIVGKDFTMRSSSRFKTHSLHQTKVTSTAVIESFNNITGTSIIKDYRGIDVLSSYSPIQIDTLEWVILAEIDFKEVMIPVFNIRNDIIIMSVFILLMLSAFAFFISLRITNPLMKLRAVALEIAKGNYGKTIDKESNDEVGELTESFNHMSIQIMEQTKIVREREKRLHHFYQATTDGIILHNRGTIILINQAITNLTQFKSDELIQKHISLCIVLPNPDIVNSHPKKITFESDCLRKDGTLFPVEIIENPIEYEGNVVGAMVIRDISERRISERRLQEERNKRVTSFIDGQEDERKRLSRELHDGIGQSLIGIKMRLEMLKLHETEKNSDILEAVKSFVNQTIQDVRRVSNNLMPSVLRDIGLKLAIQKLCDETEKNTGIAIHYDAETVTKIPDDRIKSYIYRITQEAIHNAVKHSKASEMSIMLIQEPTKVRLIIEDNGIGFDEATLTHRGNGLYSMQERVSILHGNITISSSPGKGVYIDARIPIPKTI